MDQDDRGLAFPLEQCWIAGLFLAGLIIALGTVWAFQKGAHDFAVFHAAWSMVLGGRGLGIYDPAALPDRFLYAPGFAWLLSPLALLPRHWALGLWCLAKAAAIGLVVRELGRTAAGSPRAGLGLAAGALLLVARPLLIDLEYGQVNIFILALAVWALSSHFDRARSAWADVASWALLAFAAVTKVFPLPLLLVPWLVDGPKLARERIAIFAGVAIALLVPLVSLPLAQLPELYARWVHALMAKGLPLESHNQSFIALLHHFFSGEPTFVLAEGLPPLPFGAQVFSNQGLALLSFAWTFLAIGAVVTWILRGPRHEEARWSAVLIALVIVPSHLIWKPYFVLGLPVAVVFLRRDRTVWLPLVIFFAMNLSGFDFMGHRMGALLEAAAVMFLAHLVLIARAAVSQRESKNFLAA